MKHKHDRPKMALVLALAIAVVPVFATAAEQQIGGKTIQPVLPLAGKTQLLAGPIQMQPSKVRKLATPKPAPPAVEISEVKTVCNATVGGYTSYHYMLGTIKNVVKHCSTANYSVQDQQAAGCKGSDTLDQCHEKLFNHCVSTSGGYQMKFRGEAEKELASARKLAQIAQALANHTEYMLNTYGK